ncbi:hypothetical protein ACFVYR_05480 [Streptomyces sp. NPDC058284]|uniref:hypothetical protein n=1 Tax=unclassified Streptomyces TaxID=2593676 RepID=UPI00365E12DD
MDIGRIAPSARPWPTEVHELIAAQQAEIARLRAELASRVDDRATERTAERTVVIEAPPAEPPRRPSRRTLAVAAVAAVAVGALTATAVHTLTTSGRESEHTTGTRPRATPTAARATSDQTPDTAAERATEAPRLPTEDPVEAPATPETGPSPDPEPSRQAPTKVRTRPSTRPAAIADCGGQALDRPASLLLACGDGGSGLDALTWTGWGTPTARATGQGRERVCTPSCAEGREARYPVTVTVSGLAAGRYTVIRVDAPQAPGGSADYSLGPYGPTRRG